MKRRFALGGAGAVAAAAALLSGCVVITAQTTSQVAPLGVVQSNTSYSAVPTNTSQVFVEAMVAYQVPATVTEPSKIVSVSGNVTFLPEPTYTAELQRVSPAAAGKKWVGFMSGVFPIAPCPSVGPCPTIDFELRPQWQLNRGADGSPFVGPFTINSVSGLRRVDSTQGATPDRPVKCASPLTNPSEPLGTLGNTTTCQTGNSAAGSPLPTQDLGLLAGGATASVLPGQTASMTFQAKFAGAAGPTATFSTSTTLAGATPSANVINFTPTADQQAPVVVQVPVPANAAPGTYDVNLVATVGAQTRTGVGKLTVTAPPVAAPPPPPVTIVNNPVKVVKAPKRLNAKVRFRIAVGKNLQFLRLNVVGAPTKARINVKCVKGCRLNKASLSSGKTVNLSAFFRGKSLRPGVKLEIRVTKKGFLGQFFRYSFTSAGVKGTECTISLKGKIGGCTPA